MGNMDDVSEILFPQGEYSELLPQRKGQNRDK